jgi:hypothetical protein
MINEGSPVTASEKPEHPEPQERPAGGSGSTQTVDDNGTAASSSAEAEQEDRSEPAEGGADTPPWQRAAAATPGSDGENGSGGGGGADIEDTQTIPKHIQDQDTVRTELPKTEQPARTTVSFSSGRPGVTTSVRRPSRGPRRATLQIRRVDPWSVLKLALVLSVAGFFVWMIAVAVLYGVLDGMGVWEQLNGTITELTQPDDAAAEPLISAGRVFGVASIIGAINIVLITALATVSAFIYNVAADFAGGVEITLSERD